MRIVIIGASGNVGTALLRELADRRPDDRIIGVARRTPANVPPYDGAEWASIDVSADGASTELARVLEPGDTVVNLAWGFQPTRDVEQLERVGVGGLRAVLAVAERVDLAQIVHMSSVGAYRGASRGRRVDETWPTDGVPSSAYSRHKAAAERLLDAFETGPDRPVVTRFRPGLIFQHEAGSELLRYTVPGYVPAWLIRVVPVLPMDRRLIVPVVHADDVADAFVTAIERRAPGAFNLAAEPPITRDDIAEALHAHPVHVPSTLVRAAVAAGWHARLMRLSPGWIDLAFSAPLLDTGRARSVLDWRPRIEARAALAETIAGMAEGAATSSPVLRRRTVGNQATELIRSGPITQRERS